MTLAMVAIREAADCVEDREFGIITEGENGIMYMSLVVNDAKIMIPLNPNTTVSQIHDNTKGFMEELLHIQGVQEVFEKYGARIKKK